MGNYLFTEFKAQYIPATLDFWLHTPGIGLGIGDEPESLAAFLVKNEGLSEVVLHSGQIIASLLCGTDGRRAYVYHVAVRPEYRGKALGRELVERCLARLKGRKLGKVHLFCFADNQAGLAFWDALHFENRSDVVVRSMVIDQPSCGAKTCIC